MSFAVFRRGISHRIRTRLFSSGNTNSSKRRINGEQQQQQRSSPSLAFASDNTAGVDPRIFAALQRADSAEETYLSSYAYDRFTNAAVDRFKENFGQDIDVHFVFGGTAGDVLAISAMLPSSIYAIVCASTAHLNTSQCGAAEKFTGSKVIAVPSDPHTAKLTPDSIDAALYGFGDQHSSQPLVLTVSQSTEFGTVYSMDELRQLRTYCDAKKMLLHIDGARFANAVVAMPDVTLADAASVADTLTFGGAKNGLMFGEAIVFYPRRIRARLGHTAQLADFRYIRKQAMQLYSKSRYVGAQFEAYLGERVWSSNASHANAMAAYLGAELAKLPQLVRITRPIQANAVFVEFRNDRALTNAREHFVIDFWDPPKPEMRLMTSFRTTRDEIDRLINTLQ